jgi:hypothetical protein
LSCCSPLFVPWPKAKPTPAAGGDKAKPGATTTADAPAEDEDKPKSDDAAEAKPAATTAAGEKAKPAGPSLDALPVVMALLDEAAKLAGPEAVAQYFGAPPAAASDDQEARPALYDKLGWKEYAAWERLRLARQAH